MNSTAFAPPAQRRSLISLWFIALALTWGSSFLFIKIALDGGVAPAEIVLLRLVLGAVTLNAILLATRHRWPREGKLIGHLAVVAFLLCVLPLLLFAWAGQFIPSGLSSIYNATTPLMTMAIALVIIPNEKLSRLRGFGILVGALGILAVLSPWSITDSAGSLAETGWAQTACLLGTASYGLAFGYMRRFVSGHGYEASTIAAVQVTLAAVMMLIPAPFILGGSSIAWSPSILIAILVLGIFGSGIAYIWNTTIVQAWGATPASTVTYLSPLVGVVLGILILGESLSWNQPVGGAVTIVGILISQGAIGRRNRAQALQAQAQSESEPATVKHPGGLS